MTNSCPNCWEGNGKPPASPFPSSQWPAFRQSTNQSINQSIFSSSLFFQLTIVIFSILYSHDGVCIWHGWWCLHFCVLLSFLLSNSCIQVTTCCICCLLWLHVICFVPKLMTWYCGAGLEAERMCIGELWHDPNKPACFSYFALITGSTDITLPKCVCLTHSLCAPSIRDTD